MLLASGIGQLREKQFLAVLGDLLKHRNHVNNGTGGQNQIAVRSTSIGAEGLAEASDLVRSTKPWSIVTTERIESLTAVVPSDKSIKTAREETRFAGELFSRPDWTRFEWTAPTARPPAESPDHLTDVPARQRFAAGAWANDLIFERGEDGPRFGENRWVLPRRWRITGAFKCTLIGEPRYMPQRPRRSRNGYLTIYVSQEHPVDTITVPDARDAITHALAVDGQWARVDAEDGEVYPSSKVLWARPSNEARYLTGILGMMGGLRRGSQFLLHQFLRTQLARMGGTPHLNANDVTPTLNRLRDQVQRTPHFNIKNEGERRVLANLIVKASRELKRPRQFISFEQLKIAWKEYRRAYWAANPKQGASESDVDWDRHEDDSLVGCLIEMRRRQILFQGYQWTCHSCNHRNWEDLSALAPELACGVCKKGSPAPVEIDWLFRPNDFLIESLRDHSVLSLVWLLSTLSARARTSMISVGPTAFGLSDQWERPDAEADLLVLLDGEGLLCEVKSSWRDVRNPDLENFATLATRLRPDHAILAVMEEGRGPEREIEAIRAALIAESIGFELITPRSNGWEDGPYLHID